MAYNCKSNAKWVEQMGYAIRGGCTTKVVRDILQTYPDIDMSHFTGQGWNKDNNSYDLLSHTYKGRRDTIKRALISKRGYKCERCGLTEWNNESIPLEVHHINGNNTDNSPENLQLLCPNCHAQTKTYRGKNIQNKRKDEISEEILVEALRDNPSIRQALIQLGLAPKGGNYERVYRVCAMYPDLAEKFLKK